MTFRNFIDQQDPDDIVKNMLKIDRNLEHWKKASRATGGLWDRLSHSFLNYPGPQSTHKLYNWFKRNRRDLMGRFAKAVGVNIGKLRPPISSSTPTQADVICSCKMPESESDTSRIYCDTCHRWFHGICIRVDVNKMSKYPTFECPECQGNTGINYPSAWLENVSLPLDEVSSIQNDAPPVELDTLNLSIIPSVNPLPETTTDSHIAISEYPSVVQANSSKLRSLSRKKPRHMLPDSPKASKYPNFQSSASKDRSSSNSLSPSRIPSDVLSDEDLQFTHYNESLHGDFVFDDNVLNDDNSDIEEVYNSRDGPNSNSKVLSDDKDSSPSLTGIGISEPQDPHKDFLCEENSKYMKDQGILIPPKNFSVNIDRSKWSEYEFLDVTGTRKLRKHWASMIRKELEPHNNLCRFAFRHSEFLHGRFKKFWMCSGYCKHGHAKDDDPGIQCWNIEIRAELPSETSAHIVLHVKCTGVFQHRYASHVRNHIKGPDRIALREQLRHRTAAVVATDLNKDANLDAIRCGNANSLYETRHLAQIRHEEIACDDLDQDPMMDLWKRMRKKPAIYDYVRVASGKPVCVIYFSKEQLKIVKKLRMSSNGLVGHMDGTGGITRRRDLPGGTGPVFLYAIAVTNPADKQPPLAVCEFLLSEHSLLSIAHALGFFLRKCTEYCKLPAGTPVFTRLECDDSAAMYGAIIQETTKCRNTKEYLDMCWRELFMGEIPCPTNVHLCRSHAMNMLTKNLKNPKYKLVNAKHGRLTSLFRMYLNSITMDEVVYYVRRIMVLLLSKDVSQEVMHIMSRYHQPMPSDFSAERNWGTYLQASKPKSPIYKSCAFGRLFFEMEEEVCASMKTSSASNTKNPLYSPEYCSYLLQKVLPYTPLFTHVMMKVRGDTEMWDSNNPVEVWHKLVKTVHKFTNKKLSRYIKYNLPMITGRCKSFSAKFDKYDAAKRANARRVPQKRQLPQNTPTSTPKVPKTPKPRRIVPDDRKNVAPKSSSSMRNSDVSKEGSSSPSEEYLQEMQWGRAGEAVANRSGDIGHFDNIPFIRWSFHATDDCGITFYNSCTLDNCMTVMVYCYQKFTDFRYFIDHPVNPKGEQIKHLMRLLLDIDGPQTNRARLHWYMSILDGKPTSNEVDLVGDEHRQFLEHLKDLTPSYQVQHVCRRHPNLKYEETFPVMGMCQGSVHVCVTEIEKGGDDKRCTRCNNFMENVVLPITCAPLPVIPLGVIQHLEIERIPKTKTILGFEYRLIACTLFWRLDPNNHKQVGHYTTVLFYNGSTYKYDGTKNRIERGVPDYIYVSTCWYKLVN